MRKYLFILLVFYIHLLHAQDIEVKKFELLDKDNSAVSSPRKDINGIACGLVKVKMIEDDFQFAGNVIGDVPVKDEEYWVYLANGTKRLNIKHPKYLPLTIVFADFDIAKIQSDRTYQLVLKANKNSGNKKSGKKSVVVFNVTPNDADFYMDGELLPKESGGIYALSLTHGNHYYDVKSGDFGLSDIAVVVKSKMPPVNADLTEYYANVNVECATTDADIYVNNEWKGKMKWSGKIIPGKLVVEARRNGARTVSKTMELRENDSVNINLPKLMSLAGKVNINYSPAGADVYIDNNKVGVTPLSLNTFPIGHHTLKVTGQYYKDKVEFFDLEENQDLMFEGSLEYKDDLSKIIVEANNGDAGAQYKLAECYLYYSNYISGWTKSFADAKKAVYWYRKAAEQGAAIAQGQLSYCYSEGIGVKRDYNQSFYWAQKSADQNYGYGCYLLGWHYAYGCGVSKDYETAAKCLRKAILLRSNEKGAKQLLIKIGYESAIPTK